MGLISRIKANSEGLKGVCAACGHNPTALNPLIKLKSGVKIHKFHTTDRKSGFYNKT